MIVNLRQLAEIKSNPQASNVPALCDSIETLVEALRSIAQHPHCDYGYPSSQSGDMQYAIGVADGHRCAANVARATLSTIDPRSAEAQTEGDGG